MEQLEQLRNEKANLIEKSKRADITTDELKEILSSIETINEKIALIEEIAKSKVDDKTTDDNGDTSTDDGNTDDNARNDDGQGDQKRFKPVTNVIQRGANMENEKDLEVRNNFRKIVTTRDKSMTSDVSAVIPQNLIDMIIDRNKDVGKIFASVTKTNYAVGQEYPKSMFRPTVEYASEGQGGNKQKATTNGVIKFSHYKVRCEIAWTEETDRMTLDAWETYFVNKVVEAIAIWKENEIINGKGVSGVTGILSQTPEYEKVADDLTYSDLLDFEGNLPSEKDSGAKWYMSKKTFFNTFKNILDEQGQPVASVNMGTDGKLVASILGREVVYIDEYIANHKGSGVGANTITAFIYDFKDYVFNENYNLGVQRRVNWDNDDHEMKVVFACDGKPLFTDSLIVLKRKTEIA